MLPTISTSVSYRSGQGLRWLFELSLVGTGMLFVRCLIVENLVFSFLVWNLFLAWVPLLTALALTAASEGRRLNPYGLWAGVGFWLLFLPNSPYIITDLFHIRVVAEQTLWFDTMMIFLFAVTGLLAGLYSILLIHRLLHQRLGAGRAWLLILACLVLCSYGIYIGRYGRWNSWDLFTRPFTLFSAIFDTLRNPFVWKLTLSYTFAQIGLYVGFTRFVHHRTHESLD